eukprot:2582313-Prymnesium_polylepis.1
MTTSTYSLARGPLSLASVTAAPLPAPACEGRGPLWPLRLRAVARLAVGVPKRTVGVGDVGCVRHPAHAATAPRGLSTPRY